MPFLETLRNRLASLRRRLLTRIERRFRSSGISSDVLIESMCAFALATSSSPTDVAKHFHHIRAQELLDCVKRDQTHKEGIPRALRLYVATLRETKTLFPGQMASALLKVKKMPLLQDQDVHSQVELELDIHGQFIGDDISTFTPFIRHDELNRGEAEKLLKNWARSTIRNFSQGLRARINVLQDSSDLVSLRKEILELWLSQRQESIGLNFADTLDDIRNIFIEQSTRIIRTKSSSLNGIGSFVQAALSDWQDTENRATPDLWSISAASLELRNGAKRLRQEITDGLSGKDKTLTEIAQKYKSWLQEMSAIEDMIGQVRETKWDDHEEDIDEGDEGDLLDNEQVLLSEDDPRALQEELSNALSEAYRQLQDSLGSIELDQSEHEDSGQKAVFLLRVWRELRKTLPTNFQGPQLGTSSLVGLQETIAEIACDQPLKSCSQRLAASRKASKLSTRVLWEGDPELPVLPSTWAYRLLLDVEETMTGFGPDIWSPALTNRLKGTLSQKLSAQILAQFAATTGDIADELDEKSLTNGHAQESAVETSQDESTEADDEAKAVDEEADTEEKQQARGPEEQDTSAKTNGTAINGDAEPQASQMMPSALRDRQIQDLFSVLYIIHATKTTATKTTTTGAGATAAYPDAQQTDSVDSEASGLANVARDLEQEVALEPQALDRLRKDAGEYWKRTRLLSGLLEP